MNRSAQNRSARQREIQRLGEQIRIIYQELPRTEGHHDALSRAHRQLLMETLSEKLRRLETLLASASRPDRERDSAILSRSA